MSEEQEINHAELLGEMRGELRQFYKRFDETEKRRDEWRTGLEERIDDLNKKIDPVIKDHQMIVTGGKWIVGLVATSVGVVKGWVFLKDHLPPR